MTPGLYRHYKGNLYRVLFLAEWAGEAPPASDAVLPVGMREVYDEPVELTVGDSADTLLLEARWSGNTSVVNLDERVVIYVSLSGSGRVSARSEAEFEESISDGAPGLRFERIGD